MRTIGYARVSNETQKYNLERQKEILKNYINEGIEIIEEIAKNATNLLKLVQDGEVKKIIVLDHDRISRDASEYLNFKNICDAHGVEIETIKKGTNTDNLELTAMLSEIIKEKSDDIPEESDAI